MTNLERDALRQQLIAHEGVRFFPYTDTAGKLTIGVGRNLTDVGISPQEANTLLDNDINGAVAGLNRRWPWFPTLDPMRQRVLIDMAFNLGITGLAGFPKMLAAVEAGAYDEAADEMLDSTWAKQVGTRAVKLAAMMRTGTV